MESHIKQGILCISFGANTFVYGRFHEKAADKFGHLEEEKQLLGCRRPVVEFLSVGRTACVVLDFPSMMRV